MLYRNLYYLLVLLLSDALSQIFMIAKSSNLTHLILIWLFNLSDLRVPEEGYSTNALCAHNLISTFLLFVNANYS
jgi:hypothetical protein